jgi:hypothetical protein
MMASCRDWVLCGLSMLMLTVVAVGQSQLNERNPDQIFAELWFVSIQRPASQPVLRVFSDGRLRGVLEDGQVVEGRLSPQDFAHIRRELLVDCGLAELDSRRLAEELLVTSRREGLSAQIPNADETVIRIRSSSGELREVRCPAVALLTVRFPSIASLRGLFRAQTRLDNLRSVLQVGGDAEALRIAAYASASLQSQLPEASPLSVRELSMVRRFPDGSRYIQFCRQPESPGALESPLIVAVTEVPGDHPRVSVFGGTSVFR